MNSMQPIIFFCWTFQDCLHWGSVKETLKHIRGYNVSSQRSSYYFQCDLSVYHKCWRRMCWTSRCFFIFFCFSRYSMLLILNEPIHWNGLFVSIKRMIYVRNKECLDKVFILVLTITANKNCDDINRHF